MAELYSSRITQGINDGEYIVDQAVNGRGNIQITVNAGVGLLPAGTVLGRVTATGNYGIYDNGGGGGLESARAILYAETDASVVARSAVGTAFDTRVDGRLLNWNGQGQAAIDAGIADLEQWGIIVD